MSATIKKNLCLYGAKLKALGVLSATDGNLSARLKNGRFLITPSGVSKSSLKPSDLIEIDSRGKVCSQTARLPSSEMSMHLEIFARCPQAQVVFHVHPPIATALSAALPELKELPSEFLSEVILATGRVPIVPYARPGTKDMGEALRPFLPECRLLILARHGALAWAESFEEALFGVERLEHSATIVKATLEIRASVESLKRHSKVLLENLPLAEIEFLKKKRKEIGNRLL